MSFKNYLHKYYVTACEMQRQEGNDLLMVQMLRDKSEDLVLVQKWMRSYGLFQGINTQQRLDIARAFMLYARNSLTTGALNEMENIESHYKGLLIALHQTVGRGWMSASSKLLWCAFPNDYVIYDAFVHSVLIVLQCVDDDLSSFSRIGVAPRIKDLSDIEAAVQFYMNYQAMVKHLQTIHQSDLDELRKTHKETYEYDIRIIDKLLWMIGDAKRTY
jgi:hypothetical protein